MTGIVCRIVEICIFKFERDMPWYLLLRRSNDETIYPGIWQFVSGCIEGEEKPLDAALRELGEETGLHPRSLWVVPFVNTFYDHANDAVHLSPYFAAQVTPGSEPILSREHDSSGWFPFEEAKNLLVWPGQRMGLDVIHRDLVRGREASKFTRIR